MLAGLVRLRRDAGSYLLQLLWKQVGTLPALVGRDVCLTAFDVP